MATLATVCCKGSRAGSGAGSGGGAGGASATGVDAGERRAVAVARRPLADEPLEAGECGEDGVVAVLEELAPGGVDGLGILEVLLEELTHVAGVQAGELRGRGHAR